MNRYLIAMVCAVVVSAGLLAVFYPWQTDNGNSATDTRALADIIVPDALSARARVGKGVYQAECAACHGTDAVGKDGIAPPLVHVIYEPSHHGDEAFQRAVAVGVRAHHWPFGNMPPVKGLTRADVAMIVAYVRELQQANGIN